MCWCERDRWRDTVMRVWNIARIRIGRFRRMERERVGGSECGAVSAVNSCAMTKHTRPCQAGHARSPSVPLPISLFLSLSLAMSVTSVVHASALPYHSRPPPNTIFLLLEPFVALHLLHRPHHTPGWISSMRLPRGGGVRTFIASIIHPFLIIRKERTRCCGCSGV